MQFRDGRLIPLCPNSCFTGHMAMSLIRGIRSRMAKLTLRSRIRSGALADTYRFELSPFGIDSVIVEPGIHRTPILEMHAGSADAPRTAEYGSVAESAARFKAVFTNANSSPKTPAVDDAVAALVLLIETPAGERPLRTVPTTTIQPLLHAYNAVARKYGQAAVQYSMCPSCRSYSDLPMTDEGAFCPSVALVRTLMLGAIAKIMLNN